MDTGDPIRVKIESATAWLTSLADGALPRHAAFQRRSAPQYVGDAELTVNTGAVDHPRRLWFGSGSSAWLDRPGNAVAFGELAVRLADAFGAAYGFAGDSRMAIQQRRDFLRAAADGTGTARPPTAFTDRFALRDVHWLNVYGPAFVERFGARLDGLGVRQDRLRNGGVVIWATELPDLYDEAIASHRDYQWKQPFYDAMGSGAFIDPVRGSDGSVPTWDDHRRLAGGIARGPAEPVAAPEPSPAPAEPVPDRSPRPPRRSLSPTRQSHGSSRSCGISGTSGSSSTPIATTPGWPPVSRPTTPPSGVSRWIPTPTSSSWRSPVGTRTACGGRTPKRTWRRATTPTSS